MSLNSIINKALNDIAPVQASDYEPEDNSDETYIVFSYFTHADGFTDDEPGHEIASVQVNLHCPSGYDSISMRKRIKKALYAAGFTYPSYMDISDRDGQHHIFECMIAVGIGGE